MSFSHPHVAIPPSQPNSVNDVHVHWLPCNSCNMLPIVFQGGLEVIKMICGDGMWHIDQCPPSYTIHCYKLQENTNAKCATNIKTRKMTSGIPTPCYFNFWVQFQNGVLTHHKHWFYHDNLSYCVGGFV